MVYGVRGCRILCLGLILLAESEGGLFMGIYKFSDNTFCTPQAQKVILQQYIPRFGPLDPVVVDMVSRKLNATYPATDRVEYYYEATRLNNVDCSYCPYHYAPEVFDPEWFQSGGFRLIPTPMYGPCLNGRAARKINCVQDQFLFPPEFVGEYFFPDQKSDPTLFTTGTEDSFPMHRYLMGTSNAQNPEGTSPKHPTSYGIGRGNILSKIRSISVVSLSSGVDDQNKTVDIQAPYLNDPFSGDERWLLWAQYYCSPGCHRDSQYRLVYVRPEDYQNKSLSLSYLSRKGVGPNSALTLIQCKTCPPFHAAYAWLPDSDSPVKVKGNIIALDCYPWFGAIPTLIITQQGPFFNITTVKNVADSGESLNGVLNPLENYYVTSAPCVPNTYNDVCAHTIKYFAKNGPSNKAQCKACPDGYHTEGRSGAWYCLPPAGNIFSNAEFLRSSMNSNNQSLLWTRRDRLGYEFECGWTALHCHQCGSATKTVGFLPDEFNQAVIFKHILAVEPCKSGSFCPHPLQVPITCPRDFPWSPVGSSSILNCTCARGTYLFSGNKTCLACNAMDQCAAGFYMSGWRSCMQRDGATNGGVCVQCLNKPANADYNGGPGFESGLPPAYTGVCSFKCRNGFLMHMYGDVVSFCSKTYTCDPILLIQLKNIGGKTVYNSDLNLYRDSFSAQYNAGSAEMCTTDPRLTTEISKASNGGWKTVSETCALANSSLCSAQRGAACTVSAEAAYDRDVACKACPLGVPINGSYTSSALDGSTSISLRSSMCSVRCNDKYYLNSTNYQCLLCADLEQAVCPIGYNIRGQGCLSDHSLFNPANLSASCTRCSIDVSSTQSGISYLDLQAVGGCRIESCPDVVVLPHMYISVVCGAYSRGGTLSSCATVSQCGPDQFLYGSCTRTSTGVCTNCTNYNPGYHRVAPCTFNTEDAHWNRCEINADGLTEHGFFCPGWGERTRCPIGKTSNGVAKTIDECYCIAGTVQDGRGGCMQFQCGDSLVSVFAPGTNTKSRFFMDYNSVMQTECYPCGSGDLAFTRGGGVGFSSCTCPFNMYGVLVNARNLTCTQCTAIPTQQQKDVCAGLGGGSLFNIPAACWRGNGFGACECALQPFNLQAVFGCISAGCNAGSGFIPVQGSVNSVLSEVSSGSAMYILRSDSLAGWNPLYSSGTDSRFDYTISKMLVTNNKDGDGTLNGIQYVLWTVKDAALGSTIFTGRLPPNFVPQYSDSYGGVGARPWRFDCIVDDLVYSLEDIGMSKLVSSQGQYGSVVAAVVKTKADGLLLIYTKSMMIMGDYSVAWGPEETTCGIGNRVPLAVGAPSNASVCATSHLFVSPVSSLASQSTFYVGFNSGDGCGVGAVHLDGLSRLESRPSVLLDLSSASKRQITAMTIMPAPSGVGVALYVAFHNVPNSVQLIKWADGIPMAESVELYWVGGSGGGKVLSLSMVWNNVPYVPAFLALVKNSNTGRTGIYTADGMQRTFTEVQGMPLFTNASNVGGVAAGLSNGWLVASGADTIFAIPIKQCSVAISSSRITPRFWDGSVCVSHTCVRARLCTSDTGLGQRWDEMEMRCVCSAGYYSYVQVGSPGVLFCRECESGYFCQNGVKNSCPLASMTSPPGSQLSVNCTCHETQYFTDGGACAQCPAGEWCPNGWDKFPCSGGFDATRSQAGSIYPTMCVCRVGFVGPKCDQCSGAKYCPIGSASINTVTNLAVRLTITLRPELAAVASLAPLSVEVTVCSGLISSLSQTFATGGIWYLKRPDTLSRRILCKYIQPSTRSNGRSMIVLVVQVETADQGNSVSNSISSFLVYNTSEVASLMTIHLIEPRQQPAIYSVVNNTEQTCPTGKTPTEDRGSCYCAPGYETSGQTSQCASCNAGYYKANAGPGVCIRCPIGTTSKIASSICTSGSSSSTVNSSTTDSTSVDDGAGNVPIIAGGVVGGVVLVALLIFGIFKIFYSV